MIYSAFSIGQVSNIVRQRLFDDSYVEVVSPIFRKSDSNINPRFHISSSNNGSFGYLRDCMELPLRKFATADSPKIFEIGPCFRQGEEDSTHRQVFYMMELYSVGQGLSEMEIIIKDIVNNVLGRSITTEKVSVRDIISAELGVDIREVTTRCLVDSIVAKYPVIDEKLDYNIVNSYVSIIEKSVCINMDTLYILTEYPMCTIDTAKRIGKTNSIYRFEAFINGLEIAHAFVDCLDAQDIHQRIVDEQTEDSEKNELIMLTKKGCLQATVGLGIGIDRLCMMQNVQ